MENLLILSTFVQCFNFIFVTSLPLQVLIGTLKKKNEWKKYISKTAYRALFQIYNKQNLTHNKIQQRQMNHQVPPPITLRSATYKDIKKLPRVKKYLCNKN